VGRCSGAAEEQTGNAPISMSLCVPRRFEFYARMRFDVRRIGQVKVGDGPVGGAKLTWEAVQAIDDEELDARLYPSVVAAGVLRDRRRRGPRAFGAWSLRSRLGCSWAACLA
jgi:hypothetical protein